MHRRLNPSQPLPSWSRPLFFRRELHWLHRTLITIREDCSNSTSLVPTLGLLLPPLACREKGSEGALVPTSSLPALPFTRWRNAAQKIATRKLEQRARGNLLRSPFHARFYHSFFLSYLSARIHETRFLHRRGTSSRFERLRDTFRFEESRKRWDWRNKMKEWIDIGWSKNIRNDTFAIVIILRVECQA